MTRGWMGARSQFDMGDEDYNEDKTITNLGILADDTVREAFIKVCEMQKGYKIAEDKSIKRL